MVIVTTLTGAFLVLIADLRGRFIDFLKDQYSQSTVNRKVAAVRGFYRFLKDAQKLDNKPV